MLYRILIAPDRRFVRSAGEDASLEGFLAYLEAVKNKYLSVLKPSEVRVTVDHDNQAHIRFLNFPGGSFSAVVAANQAVTLQSPNRQPIEGRLLRADLDFQYGRYREAETGYTDAIEAERSWSGLARLAYSRGKTGDLEAADRLYREAEDELTAKEMRSYAWLEVQRGFLAFSRGAYPDARLCYDRAEAAYPGYSLVTEYQAEVLGAEGKHAEAIELFQRLVAANDRPDLQQAIAELCEIAEQPDAARHWRDGALSGYLESAQRGEVHCCHHLADFYADVAKEGAAAVKWARLDLQLRENFATQSALAWALYRNAELAEARTWIERALASRHASSTRICCSALRRFTTGRPVGISCKKRCGSTRLSKDSMCIIDRQE